MHPVFHAFDSGEVEKTHNVCSELIGKNDFDTYSKRLHGQRIFKNKYIDWAEKMLSDEEFATGLEVVDVTNMPNQSQGAEDSNKRERRSVAGCPSLDTAYLQKCRLPKDPWEFFVNRDRNRVPEKMIDSRCLCKECIDIRIETENSTNVFIVPLSQ